MPGVGKSGCQGWGKSGCQGWRRVDARGGEEFSERGTNFLNYVQHIFPRGAKNFLGRALPLLATVLVRIHFIV